MSSKTAFDLIKKQNGERFAKTIRAYDSGIFDVPNIVRIVRFAGREAEPIMNYLISLKNIKINECGVTKTPFELLSDAGYDAYLADTLEKQNAIKKYFKGDEMLCTFMDENRYKNYYIINAVRKDVDQIKRQDFPKPKRQDKYGTSVISIQVLKKGGFISIKNRYNHTVSCPDNTFESNPDNIIPGLAESIKKTFNVDFSSRQVILPAGFIIVDGQIVRYNFETNNCYFGANFYVNDGEIHEIDKDKEIMLENFIFNTKTRQLSTVLGACDAFADVFTRETENKKIQITKQKDGTHQIFADKTLLATVKDGEILSLYLPKTEKIGIFFLMHNQKLKHLDAPNLKEIGPYFLMENEDLETLTLPKTEKIGNAFMQNNQNLLVLNAPQMVIADSDFLVNNTALCELNVPNLRSTGTFFLNNNKGLEELNLPHLQKVEDGFLSTNSRLKSVNLPQLTTVGNFFLYGNQMIEELTLPSLYLAGSSFLSQNTILKKLEAPKLKSVKNGFLFSNKGLEELSLPVLENVGSSFLFDNKKLKRLDVPNLHRVSNFFLRENTDLQKMYAPKLDLSYYDVGPTISVHKSDGFLSCHPNRQETISHIAHNNAEPIILSGVFQKTR